MSQDDPARRVLIVEDHDDTRAVYRAFLERAGWTVDEAASGDEALRLAGERPPAVAIVDISIPVLDGWQTTRSLKRAAGARGVAVIAVTGHGLDEDRERARQAGCDLYLVKPIEPQRLLAEVERLAAGG